jgi:hypothetical protein
MIRKLGFGLVWCGLLIYAFRFAPPDDPATAELIVQLSTGQWADLNPLVVALFNLMGILPILYGAFLFIDGRDQKIPAFPFAIATFAVGAFALLPYLALREPNSTFSGEMNGWLKFQDSRWLGVGCAIATILLCGWGLSNGEWSDFVQQWQTSRFIHVMSLDFCLLSVLFVALLGDDLERRGWQNPVLFWAIAIVPLFGPLAYLCIRPPLSAQLSETALSS